MAANLRFSTGIEVLVLMATEPEKFHTSQALAAALATNAVVVRRLLSALSRAELVTSTKGPSGGSRLARSPKQITLRDVYRALGTGDLLHRAKHESAETKDLKKAIQGAFRKAEKSLEAELDSTTLNQLIKKSGMKAAKQTDPAATVGKSTVEQTKEEAVSARTN
jgi:Rrf2 family protein